MSSVIAYVIEPVYYTIKQKYVQQYKFYFPKQITGVINLDKTDTKDIYFKMKFLSDILDRKAELLKQIYNIMENQEFFEKTLNSEDSEILIKEAVKEKQKIIEEVIAADNTFMRVFGEFKGALNRNRDKFRPEIKKMQEKIRTVSDIDFKIRAKELRVKQGIQVLKGVPAKKIKTLKASKHYILDKYRKNAEKKLDN